MLEQQHNSTMLSVTNQWVSFQTSAIQMVNTVVTNYANVSLLQCTVKY